MKVTLVVLATVAMVLGEPPAPNQQYLPSNQYGAPSTNYGAPSTNYGAPSTNYGAPNGGKPNTQYGPPANGGYAGKEDENEPASYNFKYDVQDAESGNDFGHEESREGDVATGKYYVLLPDGRRQVVEYTADSEGYKPKISYEEVGGGNGGYPRGGGNGGYKY